MSRSSISSSRSDAIRILNNTRMKVDEYVVQRYYENEPVRHIEIVFAVGIKDGYGPEAYRVLQNQSTLYVTSVTDVPPDVTKLVTGELYVWINPKGVPFFVYLSNMNRVFKEIKEGVTVCALDTGKIWYISGSEVKDSSDFYTKSQIDEMFANIKTSDNPCKGLFPTVTNLINYVKNPKAGDWAMVGSGYPADIYAWNPTTNTWTKTGEQGMPTEDDIKKHVFLGVLDQVNVEIPGVSKLTADYADRVLNDWDGNDIRLTYSTKSELNEISKRLSILEAFTPTIAEDGIYFTDAKGKIIMSVTERGLDAVDITPHFADVISSYISSAAGVVSRVDLNNLKIELQQEIYNVSNTGDDLSWYENND